MTPRVWYPQLDPYDAARRIGALLSRLPLPGVSVERLLILDFYVANPPLLHYTHMQQDTRALFRTLELPHPKRTFLSYPLAKILFETMVAPQKMALQAFAARGLVELTSIDRGELTKTDSGRSTFQEFNRLLSATERGVADFLITYFLPPSIPLPELRQRAGLRLYR